MSITAPPYMTTTTADPEFIGYYFSSNGDGRLSLNMRGSILLLTCLVIIQSCDIGWTWSTWSSSSADTIYGQCCPTNISTTCNFLTTCPETLQWENTQHETSSWYLCLSSIAALLRVLTEERSGTSSSCSSQFVYDAYPTASQTPTLNVFCASLGFSMPTLYRALPTITPSPTGSASPSKFHQSSSVHRIDGSPAVSPTANDWIAGAVVGPVLAIVILSLLLLIWSPQRKVRTLGLV
jgi:hypothetical protein